ncbi:MULTISPECIES: type I restriction endonuclease subunit R [Nocardia]|uniref:type I restriction endonuclease subunit R n=1 Tax=Nocardia TaxID=1817 RepID=UPI0007EC1C43|nr:MULTISPECIES: type I restriction endonuclease [Nocardia]MBF6278747.1 type I restriction endonuclease subunit R [Nocardia nova]OBA54082.1 restriction endonuclease subunit R [Nocardia sp. 852002-51101_SCH5132738]OBB49661.1 restriction endonuclease subunit R [Nocardia sp. 852002-51244_SCH5132740]OBF80253.1 restriction endonuclease subunit R [Mycobacterium sp. 852002-51759_SCH5129042]
MPQHHESVLEEEICEHLADHGWLYSPNDSGYDRDLALFPDDVFAWLADTQSAELEKRLKPDATPEAQSKVKSALLQRLAKALSADLKADGGTLAVLRRGFNDFNATFAMCQFKPNSGLNATTAAKYQAMRLRVMRQVHYSKSNTKKAIDLVFFVNGIPVATAEVKTDFTQSVQHAIEQYKKDRLPKGEPLLSFATRALVHFAVSNKEVHMTTRLAGTGTVFLPFNRGDNHHAGNPPNPDGSASSYLWETILQRDTWLEILDRFMHLEISERHDPDTGKKTRTETLLFPRFHQWEAVTKLVDAARREGPGHKYLIQHSAGSGKTNSISWLAQRLASLYNDQDEKVFSSVIVVTDRTVLDAQVQEAIHQINRTTGVVAHIDGLTGSKSGELADALESGTHIIIVTIQTFPYALDAIADRKALRGKSFAIIADEAHSSQTGGASNKLKEVLSQAELADVAEGATVSAEDILAAETKARAGAKNLSFFAFTATPKPTTLELFGRKGPGGPPQPFHLYSMQQAIDEGFILDVLRNYTPYRTAFRLSHNGKTYATRDTPEGTVAVTGDGSDANLVDRSAAVKSVMNWVRLHPTNIAQKVAIIVEHFRQNVAWRLNGQAKAMVVTSSRKAAVRYKIAFDRYVTAHGYTDIAALVAFSGEVTDAESGSDEPFTETSMNPGLRGRDLRDAFATDAFQVMLVANKFQTGFDQPKLVAMYVDKRLGGVQAVQTLSRLNRTFPPLKDQTFVLDFANEVADIVVEFSKYYEVTTLADVTDPNIVHDTERKLAAAGIYEASEVDRLAADYLAKKGNSALEKWIAPAAERYTVRMREAVDTSDTVALDELKMFRKDIGTYVRQYEFLSQLFDYENPWLEKLAIYLKLLAPQLTGGDEQAPIDLSAVTIDYLGHHQQAQQNPTLTAGVPLEPAKEAGTGTVKDPQMVALEEVIAKINDLFSGDHPDSSVRNVVTHIRDRLEESETLQQQARHNTLAQFSASPDLGIAFIDAVIGAMDSSADLSTQILNNKNLSQKLLGELLPGIYKRLNAAG